MDTKQLLTIKEVMRRLQISRVTLYNLTKDGKIKSVKIGAAVRYQESDIEDFITEAKKEKVEQD